MENGVAGGFATLYINLETPLDFSTERKSQFKAESRHRSSGKVIIVSKYCFSRARLARFRVCGSVIMIPILTRSSEL